MKNKKLFMLMLIMLLGFTACQQKNSFNSDSSDEIDDQTEEVNESQQTLDESSFQNINLNIHKGTLRVSIGDSLTCTSHGKNKVNYEIAHQTLTIDQNIEGEAVLTLPKDINYDSLSLNIDNGHVYVEGDLSVKKFDMSVLQGEVNITSLDVSESSTIEVERGSVNIVGFLGTDVNAQSNEGNLNMNLSVSQATYNYQLELSNGHLFLGDKHYKGGSVSDNVDNQSHQTMVLKCKKGQLSVDFQK